MKKGVIDKLCEAINTARGLSYPDIGYLYFANIAGDGRKHRTVYAIVTQGGGVVAVHNAGSPLKTAKKLRDVLQGYAKGAA